MPTFTIFLPFIVYDLLHGACLKHIQFLGFATQLHQTLLRILFDLLSIYDFKVHADIW